MSLEKEYCRPSGLNQPETYKYNCIEIPRYNIKSMYPEKKINSTLNKHAKIFVPYTAECEYQLEFRAKDKDKPLGIATIYHPTRVKILKKIKTGTRWLYIL